MSHTLPLVLLLAGTTAAVATSPCPSSLPAAAAKVPGYTTSMRGCIGAQGKSASRELAVSIDCGVGTKTNVTDAAIRIAALCSNTPGCAAFSVLSPAYDGKLLCEIHPETIAQSSETNSWWSVWQANKPKSGRWPYGPGQGPPAPPPPPPAFFLSWDTPSSSVTGSMPLGNGQLGVNVYADAADVVWLLLSHVDALDENTNLDKLGRIKVKATMETVEAAPHGGQQFKQEMHLDNATVHIDLQCGVSLDVWVDAKTNVVRVESTSDEIHKLEATVEVWRKKDGPYMGPKGPAAPLGCTALHPNITLHADIVDAAGDDGILFYHRNLEEWTMPAWIIDLKSQQMPLDLPNTMTNITFGGYLTGGSGSKMIKGATPMQLVSATAGKVQSLSIAGIAGRYDEGVEAFIGELKTATATPINRAEHTEHWANFWTNADLTITPAAEPNNPAVAAEADRVSLLDRVNRAAFHSMAMGNISAIKFNAYGIYSAYPSPLEDYRIWGPCQWFQNIRLPYYHMLADGRFEEMKSLFGFYFRMLAVSKARTKAWYGITGTFFPETKQQTGIYDSGGMGWSCRSASPTVPIPGNTYIRYHREGGLELSLLAVDWFEHTGDVAYFKEVLLPQIEAYTDYYGQHFNNSADGKLDMFPAQALETWQCKDVPPTRDACVTNPMPQVAGLHALLPRLIALNSSVVEDAATTEKWVALLKRVPDLPIGPCMQGDGAKRSICLLPGAQLPHTVSNAENADLYAVHPYRVIGLYAQRELGITTYENRKFRGETGWSEDFMDAALLGLANETATAAIAHAKVAPYTGYRWVGFQAGIGAGGPITDHGGVATAGLRYMLMQTGVSVDGVPSSKIVLFPAWPCKDWAVKFKLHAPGQTIVEGRYDGNGTLTGFTVNPENRRADVIFADCVQSVL